MQTYIVSKFKGNYENLATQHLLPNSKKDKNALKTTFGLAYDDSGLFFVFDVMENINKSTMKEYNMPLYDEEVVELFIAPIKKSDYLEVEFNKVGGVFCGNIYDSPDDRKLILTEKNLLKTEIKLLNNGWRIEGFIPTQLIGKLHGEMLFNAYRIERTDKNDMILSAFSPTGEDAFHKPDCFAKLIFS